MKHSTLAIAVLTLGIPILAQTQTTTSPSGYENKEAPSLAYYFGMHATGRQQFADGMQKGKGVKTIRQVGYRLDYRSHTTTTAAGKSWTNVQLRISDCDFAKVGSTFAANPTTTQTLVFNNAVTWPAQIGYPSTQPAPWSTGLAFPFSSPWLYVGIGDILLDYQFSGGKLANGVSWAGNTAKLTPYFDANTSYDYASWPYTTLGTRNCVDSGQSNGAYTYLTGYTYPKSGGTVHDGDIYPYVNSIRTAASAVVVLAIGLKGATSTSGGTTFPGVTCNKLFLDVSASILLIGTTNASGNYFTNFGGYTPFAPAMINLKVWAQTAWSDSVTMGMKLSRASWAVVQGQPPTPPSKKMTYASGLTSLNGYGPFFSSSRNPLILYTH